ncbi:hypothetical protein CIW83_04395 [Tissierella sp. P1]|uniref:hypothetical protein n=1 Tax=Tissierella TaxID=41273 RepID=UPI000BA02559|nr:hypothetical protein [Tissierella sp. P1]OZV13441.1 hypothetical protein CIW83_04395 [Tissierella sp. P1]
MKIYIEDQTLEVENSKDVIDKILNEIDTIIVNSSKILSHMIIDGLEVYENYYDYFLDNIRVIEKVEIVALTYKELVDDILASTLSYLERTPDIIESLADKFYKNSDTDAWNDLNDLLGGISWIVNTSSSIDQDERLKDIVSRYEDWNLYVKELFSLQKILPDFENALSSGDNVTIADILSYEIIAIFKEMAGRLSSLVSVEANLYDLN